MTDSVEVIVVGGGMVGATIALALSQAEMSVALIEQQPPAAFAPDSAPDARVSALSPASENMLRTLGVWDRVTMMRHCPFTQMAVWETLPLLDEMIGTRLNRSLFEAHTLGRDTLGSIVENRVLQLALWQALAEVESSSKRLRCFSPAAIESLSWDSEGQGQVVLADGQKISAPLIVGADGAQSQVRTAAGIELQEFTYPQHALVATVEIAGGAQAITWQAFTPAGPQAFLPLADSAGKSWGSLVWYDTPERIKALSALDDEALLQAFATQFPPELPDLLGLAVRGAFPLWHRHATRYCDNGVVLAGDAAHTIHPLAGQGVNLGFQDAAWLAQTLIDAKRAGENWADQQVLARYQAQRMPENQKIQRLMELFCFGFSNELLPLKVLRNLGLGLAGGLKPLHKPALEVALGMSGNQSRLALGLPL